MVLIFFNFSSAIVKGKASYYAGGSLPDSSVTWTVTSQQASFIPPGLSKYSFIAPKHILLSGYSK